MSYSVLPESLTVGQYSGTRDNNFNLLRFVAACGVICSHSILLSGDLGNGAAWALGYISVNCFFIISGYLVIGSLLKRENLRDYGLSRALRIFPGLIVCVTLCTLIVGILDSDQELITFLKSPETLFFWLKNSFLVFGEVQITLPTRLFNHNPVQFQVNAPLWTLQYELLMYAILAFVSASTIIAGNNYRKYLFVIVACLAVSSMILFLANVTRSQPSIGLWANLVRFAAMFFYGAACYLLRDKIKLSLSTVFTICLLVILGMARRELFICIVYLSLGYLLLYAAYVPSGILRRFNRLGDYSYGLYIYAFPIQQIYVHFYPSIEPAMLMLATLVTTLPLAIISWHYIERPALARKPPASTTVIQALQ